MRIVVVGAGIVGASIAYRLARRDACVTVLDGGNRGGVATKASFAWINAAHGNPRHYFNLRMQAIEDWRRLETDLGGRAPVDWSGGLWWENDMEAVEQAVGELADWGYPIRMVTSREIEAREPALFRPPAAAAAADAEGSLSPVDMALSMLRAAEDFGASVVRETARRIETSAGRISSVVTDAGNHAADAVVLAAGVATPGLLRELGVGLSMRNLPGFLAQTEPLGRMARGLVLSPGLHTRQQDDGRMIVGQDFGGSARPVSPAQEAVALMRDVQALFGLNDAPRVDGHMLGLRPIPADGLPAVGAVKPVEGLYVAVMHSGVTLAALVGRLAAEEVVTGAERPELAGFRPVRPSLADGGL